MYFTISKRLPRLHYFVAQAIEAHVDDNLIDLCSATPAPGISLECGAPLRRQSTALVFHLSAMPLIFRAKSVVAALAKSNPKSAHKTSRARSIGAIISNAGDLQGLLILVKCLCPKRIRLATGHSRLGKEYVPILRATSICKKYSATHVIKRNKNHKDS